MIFKQWIKQAYGVDANDSNARFTVYNMEVAYAAGQQEHSWISVKDALPEKYRECLVYPWIGDYILTAELQSDGWCYTEYVTGYGAEVHKLPEGRVTHWKYLEEPACSTEHTEVPQ